MLASQNQEVIQGFIEDTEKLLAGKKDTYSKIIDQIRLKVLAEAQSPHLSMRLIMGINDALVEYSGKEFEQINLFTRAERRKYRNPATMDRYVQIVFESTTATEEMLIRNMDKVCVDIGITMMKYEQSNQYWSQINPQFSLLSMLMLDKMKLMMKSYKTCTIQDALDVFDFQIKEYPNLKIDVGNPQLTPMIKQSWITDMVFETLGFEEEDYIKTPGLEQNLGFRQKAEQLATMIQHDAMQSQGGFEGMMPGMM